MADQDQVENGPELSKKAILIRKAVEIFEGKLSTNAVKVSAGEYLRLLELLKEIAPNVKQIGVLRDPTLTLGTAQYAVIQSMAPTV